MHEDGFGCLQAWAYPRGTHLPSIYDSFTTLYHRIPITYPYDTHRIES